MIDKYVNDIVKNRFGTRIMISRVIEENTRRKANSIVEVLDVDNNVVIGEYTLKEFQHRDCISPLDKQFQGVGYVGIGDYNPFDKAYKLQFRYYNQFIERQYYKLSKELEQLLDFQEFCTWYNNNYYETDLKDNSERGMGGKYRETQRLTIIKANNEFNLCFLPSALSILVEEKSNTCVKEYYNKVEWSYFYKVCLPQLNHSAKILKDFDGYDYYSKEKAEERFISEIENYVRDLSIAEGTRDYIAELDRNVINLLNNFEYFE